MEVTVTFKEIKKEIIAQLNKAENEIKLAVAWLTDEDIIRVLGQRQEKGVIVQIVICDSTENFKKTSHFGGLLRYGGGMCIATQPFMHHKFCIIDDKVILNGSYNWSYPAQRNNENLLTMIPDLSIRQDKLVLLNFKAEFITLYKNATRINQVAELGVFKANSRDMGIVLSELESWEIELRQEFEDAVQMSIETAEKAKIKLDFPKLRENMHRDGGGVNFVKRLLNDEIQTKEMKSGFRKLEVNNPPRIELSLEYLVAKPKFQALFTVDEVAFCRNLMLKYHL
ncbi:phospholipase D-like domain-containing protein [Flavobacterium terrisoli]|uniref:phospholipase D-like domain-containing protein n=1 Tax=Flavobacterium terrisoli TaxID=3242195 RepID=UPI0025431265|nr:phospholipase D-like domain-containing protein [Flavobacterium buctense]